MNSATDTATDTDLLSALYRQLATAEEHSTPTLAYMLGISEAALQRGLDALQSLGLGIERSGVWLRLHSPLEPLDTGCILLHCGPPRLRLMLRFVAASTNTELLSDHSPDALLACTAEGQQRGRGRHGKAWLSPLGNSISLSLRYRWATASLPAGLSLAVGVAAVDALKTLGVVGVGLKWPNDLWAAGRKLGGILIEPRYSTERLDVVIGIGVNLRLPHPPPRCQPMTDLETVATERLSRNVLTGRLLKAIIHACESVEAHGFAVYQDAFAAVDALKGQPIRVTSGVHQAAPIDGVADGIERDGALRVQTVNGCQRIITGSVTLRVPAGS